MGSTLSYLSNVLCPRMDLCTVSSCFMLCQKAKGQKNLHQTKKKKEYSWKECTWRTWIHKNGTHTILKA